MAVMGIFLAGVYAVACGGEKQAEKLRDLEFAVIGPDETPQELAQTVILDVLRTTAGADADHRRKEERFLPPDLHKRK